MLRDIVIYHRLLRLSSGTFKGMDTGVTDRQNRGAGEAQTRGVNGRQVGSGSLPPKDAELPTARAPEKLVVHRKTLVERTAWIAQAQRAYPQGLISQSGS